MIGGFNHNFLYRGEVYHVQTEDGGLKNPNIVTLLYRDGTILASKKTSYADIARVDNLKEVVEDLMKEQHKEMLRRLKSGELDDVIAGRRSPPAAAPPGVKGPPASAAAAVQAAPGRNDQGKTETETEAPPSRPGAAAAEKKDSEPAMSLDDVILSYLVGDDES